MVPGRSLAGNASLDEIALVSACFTHAWPPIASVAHSNGLASCVYPAVGGDTGITLDKLLLSAVMDVHNALKPCDSAFEAAVDASDCPCSVHKVDSTGGPWM